MYSDILYYGHNSLAKPESITALMEAVGQEDGDETVRLHADAIAYFERKRVEIVNPAFASRPRAMELKLPPLPAPVVASPEFDDLPPDFDDVDLDEAVPTRPASARAMAKESVKKVVLRGTYRPLPPSTRSKVVLRGTYTPPPPPPVMKVVLRGTYRPPPPPPVMKVVLRGTYRPPPPPPVMKVVLRGTYRPPPPPVNKVRLRGFYSPPPPPPVKKVRLRGTYTTKGLGQDGVARAPGRDRRQAVSALYLGPFVIRPGAPVGLYRPTTLTDCNCSSQ